MTSEEDIPRRKLFIFGRNVAEIPCFKQSFMYGILGGLGVGLGTFLLTSRPRRASNIGFSSFVGITMSYWFYCRYQWSKENFAMRQIQGIIRESARKEIIDDPVVRKLEEEKKFEA